MSLFEVNLFLTDFSVSDSNLSGAGNNNFRGYGCGHAMGAGDTRSAFYGTSFNGDGTKTLWGIKNEGYGEGASIPNVFAAEDHYDDYMEFFHKMFVYWYLDKDPKW